jgi:hypothetical protein
MTGYKSKKEAALDEEGMYLVHHTKRKVDDDDDIQVYAADTAIVNTLLPKLYSIIDRLLDGQDKALVIEARRVLPKAYKNSFEKGKSV